MRARLVVFPIKGRNWCFSRSIEHNSVPGSLSSEVPITFRDLWKKISTSSDSKPEILIDFVANKMNRGWAAFEKAPPGSFKNKIHRLGVRLLARVKPSEIFLKSISNEDTSIVLTYPSSLNARLVRRRLRHIAFRGTIIHKNYFYGSASLLPLTTVLTILPLPNIPFFWILFRTYSHWRALKGSEKLLQLVSDQSENEKSARTESKSETLEAKSKRGIHNTLGSPWVLQPSEELEKLLHGQDADNGLGQRTITDICKIFHLNTIDVLKYRDSL